jgi:hypothetical protein
VVRGTLIIDEDVNPETIMEKVEHIDNTGEIICSSEQYGPVSIKLRMNTGELIDGSEDAGSDYGFLKL